jgi:hypothetical protein
MKGKHMFLKIVTSGIGLFMLLCAPLCAQTHNSISLGNQVYYILEQAEIKGLCPPLPGVRPYTQSVVIAAINGIFNSGKAYKLKETERAILEQYLNTFSKPKKGIDWLRGAYYAETAIGKKEAPLSINVGLSADIEGSTGVFPGDKYFGTETWLTLHLNGDLGNHVSWGITGGAGLIMAPRKELGLYNTYYPGFDDEADEQYKNQEITVYSGPLTYFPYTYKKRWDDSIHSLEDLDGFGSWPERASIGYTIESEITASFLEDKLIVRTGRISHEWGSTSLGSSLVLNQMARPFLGIETSFYPVSWFGIATLTGFLEYFNTKGQKTSGTTFQNAYSTTMLQFRYKNYLFLDIHETVVWPKRFEIGYLFPLISSLVYKGNVGDFDNLGVVVSFKAQYPGIGNVWFSFFGDEARVSPNGKELDRIMIAWQSGVNVPLPFLAFSSLKMSYTKINPYCYTHNRNYNPWYGDIRMETAYANNGVCLGYYLPPNSDEILARFQTMPAKNLVTHLQYQMIRHGADFGSSAVDGSNLLSELDTDNRDSNPVLRRFFLHDGAYQWIHIGKLGAEWNLSKAPIAFYSEIGMVYSYFTNTSEPANSGEPHPYSKIDTSEYPKSISFVAQLGIKIFPR